MMVHLLDIHTHSALSKLTQRVEESLSLTFDERPPPSKISSLVDDDLVESPTLIRQVSQDQ